MDTGLDENQAELGVSVLAVALKVLADGNSLKNPLDRTSRLWGEPTNLLDQHVQILWDLWGEAYFVTPSV